MMPTLKPPGDQSTNWIVRLVCTTIVMLSRLARQGGAQIDKVSLSYLDGGDGGVDVLRDDITAVEQRAGHVLAVARVALGHHLRKDNKEIKVFMIMKSHKMKELTEAGSKTELVSSATESCSW